MANFLKNLIENDKKELKRLEQMADKIELLADQMKNLERKQKNFAIDIKMVKHWMNY